MRHFNLWLPLLLIGISISFLSVPVAAASDKSVSASEQTKSQKDTSFSFVVWGHPRGKTDGEPALHFQEILERISELKADLLIITGDVIYGMLGKPTDPNVIRSDWEKFDAGVNRLGIPVYRLPGNHDIHNTITRSIYLERYPALPMAFTFKGCRFILLDTLGIDRQDDTKKSVWRSGIKPFDDSQLEFIRNEVRQQKKYNHLFFFMHHPQPWSDPSGFWWKDIHPLLINGKTRAVFAGTPWYFKYAHMEQDGIHYILSSCLHTPKISQIRILSNPAEWAMYKQLDNLQYIRVDGGKYTIRTIVVGALDSEALNWRFWSKVESLPTPWFRNVMLRFHIKFHTFRSLVLLAAAWGITFLIMGILLTTLWIHWRRNQKNP